MPFRSNEGKCGLADVVYQGVPRQQHQHEDGPTVGPNAATIFDASPQTAKLGSQLRVVARTIGLGVSVFLNNLDEFFVGQEPDITTARCRLGAAIIHAEMLRQHIKRADLGVQPDLDRAVGRARDPRDSPAGLTGAATAGRPNNQSHMTYLMIFETYCVIIP